MNDLGKKVDKILTYVFGALLVGAIVMMIVSFALQNQSLKVAAIVIALCICVISFILDYVLKAVFKDKEKTKAKEVIEEKSENEEQEA